jgi:hypothetical protein
MAYIPGFEHDIFISYAHVDNCAIQGKSCWVNQFHEELEIALAKCIGRMGLVKIWRDMRLEGNQLLDNTIQSAIDKSALFLALTSHGYFHPDSYCPKELQLFHTKAQAEKYGLQMGDRSRIYNVLLSNIPYDKWPKEFSGMSGYPFHDAEKTDAVGMPTDPADKRFHDQLRKLVDSLHTMLQAFKTKAEGTATRKPGKETVSLKDIPCVFVSDVSDSLRSVRSRVVNDLQRKGIKIVSNIPPPYEARAHEERVSVVLKESVLSVHLLDGYSGREIEGEPDISYPRKQVELALNATAAQLIWASKDLDLETIEDECQKEFLTKLESDDRTRAAYDFIRGIPADLVPQIIEKIERLQTAAKANGAPHAVLLDTHVKDQRYALDLSKFLLENNIQPYINPQEDDPGKNMDALEARLKEVSMLMILFGSVNENWVRQRLSAALQLSFTKKFPIKYFCVFAIPPRKETLISTLAKPYGYISLTTVKAPRLNPERLPRYCT